MSLFELPKKEQDDDVIEKKYMLVITSYPSGKEFQRIFPIGEDKRQLKKKEEQKPQRKMTLQDTIEE